MTTIQLENLLQRAAEIARDRDFRSMGSQALRGVSSAIPRDFKRDVTSQVRQARCRSGSHRRTACFTWPKGGTARAAERASRRKASAATACPEEEMAAAALAFRRLAL